MVGMAPIRNAPASGAPAARASSTKPRASASTPCTRASSAAPWPVSSTRPRRPLEHRHAEPGLELADLRGKRRLRHAAPLRRPAEMAALGDRHEVFKIAQGQAGEGQTWRSGVARAR
jgi:hypothetical protein